MTIISLQRWQRWVVSLLGTPSLANNLTVGLFISVVVLILWLILAVSLVFLSAWLFMLIWNSIVREIFSVPMLSHSRALHVKLINVLIGLPAVFIRSIFTRATRSIFASTEAPQRIPGWTSWVLSSMLLGFWYFLVTVIFLAWWNHVIVDLFSVKFIGFKEALGLAFVGGVLLAPINSSFQLRDRR